jgi:hypothetical protein
MKNNLPNSHLFTTVANDMNPRPVGVHLSTLDAKFGAKVHFSFDKAKKI